jgi:hypothetical protein
MTFADGPGGRPLGDAPRSQPLVRCATRRSIRIRGGRHVAKAFVLVNGRRAPVYVGGRRHTSVPRRALGRRLELRGLPAGVVTVRVIRVTERGRRLVESRRLRTC